MRALGTAASRNLGRAISVAAWLLALGTSACNPYDVSRIHAPGDHPSGGKDAGNDGSTPTADGGDGGPCIPHTELCNDKDDDCDGMIDEKAEADLDCESRLLHASSVCNSGACVQISCDPGFNSCDGEPSNGCEPLCSFCGMCDDAGADDGGADDGG